MTSKETKKYVKEFKRFAKNVSTKEARGIFVKAGVYTKSGHLTKTYK